MDYHMVRAEGQENGRGVWEVDGYEKIVSRITDIIDDIAPDFEVSEIYVFGSFGAGYGVPGHSDLDILISGVFNRKIEPTTLEATQSKLAEEIESENIVADFDVFTGADISVEDPSQARGVLQLYHSFEPVETYYNLTEDRLEYF